MKENRNCQNCKQDFAIEQGDFTFYEKIKVPPPRFCSDCRFQRRLMFRNNRVFYRRECDLCQKKILSVYKKESPYTIYCRECWIGDKWDPKSYALTYDPSRSFFEQFRELQKVVPRINLYQENFVNSEYCNYGLDFKECYLMFGGRDNERIYFGNQLINSKDSMDIAFSEKIEFSYSLFECQRTNKVFFSIYSTDCVDSWYLLDCKNCINCFGCVGLVNKQYHIFNKPYSKEEYDEFIKQNTGSYKKHIDNLKKLKGLRLSLPHRFARIYKSADSDGDDSYELNNSHHIFASGEVEDSAFLFFCKRGSRDCYDNSFVGFNCELSYENCHAFGGNDVIGGIRSFDSQKLRYSEDCHNCSNIFGCEGLRKQNYCILNKQYTKEEYEKLAGEIIENMKKAGEYGEFFPIKFSPFAYNETIAQEYFPLSKEEVLARGYEWKDIEERNYQIDIKTEDLPDGINDVANDILNKVIACAHAGSCKEQCTEAFKITAEELKFYKRMNLPLPRFCPNCRHYGLINSRNPFRLWERKCMCDKKNHFHEGDCMVEFKTTYNPDSPEVIYCEKCYQQEVY